MAAKTTIQEFWGDEKVEKRFLNKRNGICIKCKSKPRDELEKFKVLQLNIPDTSRVLTFNGIVNNYFSESSDSASMKCECCKHQKNCPQTGVCKPKAFPSKKKLVKSPDVLLVQINRFANMTGFKLKTKYGLMTSYSYQLEMSISFVVLATTWENIMDKAISLHH